MTVNKLYKQIEEHAEIILEGKMLAIDPSSGSRESKAGYAYFVKGELVESGTIPVDHYLPIHRRLAVMHDFIALKFPDIDILIIEQIRGRLAHIYLAWAVGVAIEAARSEELIEMNIKVWKSYAEKLGITKSDENDACSIGLTAIHLAEEI